VALSDFRAGRHPTDDVGGATSATPGSPPIASITFPTCRAQYPGGPDRCMSVSSLPARPSPNNRRVGIHNFTFEACSSFTRVTACKDAARPQAGTVPRLRPSQLPDRAARWLSRLTDNYMSGSSFHWRSAPLGHAVILLFYKHLSGVSATPECPRARHPACEHPDCLARYFRNPRRIASCNGTG